MTTLFITLSSMFRAVPRTYWTRNKYLLEKNDKINVLRTLKAMKTDKFMRIRRAQHLELPQAYWLQNIVLSFGSSLLF